MMRIQHSLRLAVLIAGRTPLLPLVAVLAACTVVIGCAEQGRMEPVDVEAERASITEVINQSAEAIQNQAFDTLGTLVSNDWVLYTGEGTKWTLADMQAFFQEHISDHTINFSNVAIDVSGDGTMAWATFDEQTQYLFDGNPVQENAIFTALFKKTDAGWEMVHLHRSAEPPPAEEGPE